MAMVLSPLDVARRQGIGCHCWPACCGGKWLMLFGLSGSCPLRRGSVSLTCYASCCPASPRAAWLHRAGCQGIVGLLLRPGHPGMSSLSAPDPHLCLATQLWQQWLHGPMTQVLFSMDGGRRLGFRCHCHYWSGYDGGKWLTLCGSSGSCLQRVGSVRLTCLTLCLPASPRAAWGPPAAR